MKMRSLLHVMLFMLVVALLTSGCTAITKNAVFQKKVDMSLLEEKCIIGKTTPQEVIALVGEPYSNSVTKKGNGDLSYMSMGFFGGDAQSIIVRFKNGRLAKYGPAIDFFGATSSQ